MCPIIKLGGTQYFEAYKRLKMMTLIIENEPRELDIWI